MVAVVVIRADTIVSTTAVKTAATDAVAEAETAVIVVVVVVVVEVVVAEVVVVLVVPNQHKQMRIGVGNCYLVHEDMCIAVCEQAFTVSRATHY